MKYFEQALEDFNKLTDEAEDNLPATAKAYFYRAKTLKKMGNISDAVLHFEQVIKNSEDDYLSGSALYEIAKIRIQQKDFYEAYYNLKRTSHFHFK